MLSLKLARASVTSFFVFILLSIVAPLLADFANLLDLDIINQDGQPTIGKEILR